MAAKKEVVELTKEYWDSANSDSKNLMEKFLKNSTQLTPQSLKQYRSVLMVWISYLNKYCDNIHVTEAKGRDLMFFQNWLYDLGIYEATMKMRKSIISSFNDWIVLMWGDKYPTFHNFATKGVKIPETVIKHEKEPVTDREFEIICDYLEKTNQWQILAWFVFTYTTAARKNESAQLLKNVVNQKPVEKIIKVKNGEDGEIKEIPIKKYRTNPVKRKGKKSSEKKSLSFDENTMYYLKKWMEVRGEDDCEYMFVTGRGENTRKPNIEIFNRWCKKLENILGRRFHPHLLRSSRATSLFLKGKNIESIQALLGHKNSDTTKLYIVDNSGNEDEDEIFAL